MRQSKTKEILRYLAIGSGIAVLSILAPQLPYKLLRIYIRKKEFERSRFLADLKRLQARKLINFTILPDNQVKIVLEKEGKILARKITLQYDIDSMKIMKPRQWDKKWRMVIFDIPHENKQARDSLRQKLNQLGFYQLQKSVFIYPHPCEKEIEFIANFYEVRDHILFLTISHFKGEEKLRHSVFHI